MLVASPAGFGLRYLFVSLVSLFILMYSIRWIVLDRARVRLCFVLALRSSFVHVVGGLLPALSRFFVVLTHVCVPFLCTSSGVALHVGCASLVCVSAVPRRYVVLCVLWVLSRSLVFVCSCGGGCLSPASTLGALLFFPLW